MRYYEFPRPQAGHGFNPLRVRHLAVLLVQEELTKYIEQEVQNSKAFRKNKAGKLDERAAFDEVRRELEYVPRPA
jgi:hypothetical protein